MLCVFGHGTDVTLFTKKTTVDLLDAHGTSQRKHARALREARGVHAPQTQGFAVLSSTSSKLIVHGLPLRQIMVPGAPAISDNIQQVKERMSADSAE